LFPDAYTARAIISELLIQDYAACCYLQGSCFQRKGLAGTVDYWVKLPGLALVNGNCYCYALDMFQGEQQQEQCSSCPLSETSAVQAAAG
jgi:hypothetical protein